MDVRIITACNKDLLKLVREKRFREDLCYRLSVFPISIPSLRERNEDIPLLVDFTLKRLCISKRITDRAHVKPQKYQLSGNIRELENTIKRAVVFAQDVVKPEHIPLPGTRETRHLVDKVKTLKQAGICGRAAAEAEMIKKMLQQTKGNKSEAVRRLEVSYKTLLNRIKQYKKKRLL